MAVKKEEEEAHVQQQVAGLTRLLGQLEHDLAQFQEVWRVRRKKRVLPQTMGSSFDRERCVVASIHIAVLGTQQHLQVGRWILISNGGSAA
jgi:hypothetical protein